MFSVLIKPTNIAICYYQQDQPANKEESDVIGRIRRLEQDIRSYADRPVINWYVNMLI